MPFATETFESFNAVLIHTKSIHSNRQALSIAMAFAQGNHVQHLLSRGYFIPAHLLSTSIDETLTMPGPEMLVHANWCSVGPGPLHLIESDHIVWNYLGHMVIHTNFT